jgi:hypothetical protein
MRFGFVVARFGLFMQQLSENRHERTMTPATSKGIIDQPSKYSVDQTVEIRTFCNPNTTAAGCSKHRLFYEP